MTITAERPTATGDGEQERICSECGCSGGRHYSHCSTRFPEYANQCFIYA